MVAETLEWGNSILESIKSCDLFILDEVGPLNSNMAWGLVAGLDIVDSHKKFPMCCCSSVLLCSMACKRWPWAQVIDLSAEAGCMIQVRDLTVSYGASPVSAKCFL